MSTGENERCLVAGKREAYEIFWETAATFIPKRLKSTDREGDLRWKAWPNRPMTTIILAGDTIFSGGPGEIYEPGGPGKVYATRATDGAELWSAVVPGQVTDLAVADGRLFVACSSGTVLCFGEPR